MLMLFTGKQIQNKTNDAVFIMLSVLSCGYADTQ
jgi:hypothetical protein